MREPKNFGHIDKHLHLSTCLLALAVAAGDFSSAANSRISPPVNEQHDFLSASYRTAQQRLGDRLYHVLLPSAPASCLLACLLGVPCLGPAPCPNEMFDILALSIR